MLRRNARRAALAVAVAALAGAAAPAVSQAQTALPPCTSTIGYDASIPTWQDFWAANPDPDAVRPAGLRHDRLRRWRARPRAAARRTRVAAT